MAPSAPGTAPGVPPPGPPPNQTLYVRNLNDKIGKPDLRLSLYLLFATYGVVLDVVALKTMKHRGQAFIAMRDIPSATLSMRELQGREFLGKQLKIEYAKAKSNTIAKLDGTYRLPAVAGAVGSGDTPVFAVLPGQGADEEAEKEAGHPPTVAGQKRPREEDEVEDGEEDEDQEMEMDEDDD